MKIIVKVKPSSKVNEVSRQADGSFLVKTTAPAKENKANEAVIELLSEELGMAKSLFRIVKGLKSKDKLIGIVD